MDRLEEQLTRLGWIKAGIEECASYPPSPNSQLVLAVIQMTDEEYKERLDRLSRNDFNSMMARVNEILHGNKTYNVNASTPLYIVFSDLIACKELQNEDILVLKTIFLTLMKHNHNCMFVRSQGEAKGVLLSRSIKDMEMDVFHGSLELMSQEQFTTMMIKIKTILQQNGIRKGRANRYDERFQLFNLLCQNSNVELLNTIELRCLLTIILGQMNDYDFYNVLKNHCIKLSKTNQRLIKLPL